MSGRLAGLYTGDHTVDLEPPRATLQQLALTNRLELVPVESDVFDVVHHLKRIDPGLHMMADLEQGIYVLYWRGMREKEGRGEMVEDLVGAYRALDSRIVTLIERIDAQGRGRYDLQAELEKMERERELEAERRHSEVMGDAAEKLRHALRNDLGAQGSSVHVGYSRGIHQSRKGRRRPKRGR